MRTLFTVLVLILFSLRASAQAPPPEILMILHNQVESWNAGNLDRFMEGYWNNDSLIFVGSKGVTYGYTAALNNYRKSYPDKESMGKLSFNILQVKKMAGDIYFVVGKWTLKRGAGDLSGHYTLLFRRINGQWRIIADHSS